MIQAIIFDFDGLILDTEGPDYQAWQEIYHEHGGDLPLSVWVGVIGGRMSDNGFEPISFLESQIGRAVDGDALRARHHERSMALTMGQRVLPGVEAWIAQAKGLGLKLAVASSSPRSWVHGHLGRLGLLHHFDVTRTSDDVTRTKPSPELFLSALEALRVGPLEAIVLEDSSNGVTAAKRAGIFTIAVPNDLTRHSDLSHADIRLETLADMSVMQLLESQQARPAS